MVYTGIVVIPLLALFAFILFFSAKRDFDNLWSYCQREIQNNTRQLQSNLDIMASAEKMIKANSDFRLFLDSPESRNEEETISTLKNEVSTMERILSVNSALYSIRIFTDNIRIPERFPVILHSERTDLAALNKWEYNYSASFMGGYSSQILPSACYTAELYNNKHPVAWYQVAMKMDDFLPFLYRVPEQNQGDYGFKVHRDSQGMIDLEPLTNSDIEAKAKFLSEKDVRKLEKLFSEKQPFENSNYGEIKLGRFGNRQLACWSYIPELDFVLVHSCSTKIIWPDTIVFILVSVLGLVISAFLIYFLITTLTKRMLKGVYTLVDGMKQVRSGNYSVQIPVTHTDEIGETQKTFNLMADQLNQQIQQIKTEQQLIADTEMKAMQNQINAHFLYNVLETIHMQAVISDNKETAESILVLGKMMRYCLRWRVHTVTLSQEMEYISSYVYILNIRNDYKITLEVDIPEEFYERNIPKMMLQPFVENSFIHGIEPNAQDAVIKIFLEVDEENGLLWLCEQDFGGGISPEKLREINEYLADDEYERDSTGHIGVKNIQQRLTMFFGKEYRLKISSQKGKGTLVKVPIPLHELGEDEKNRSISGGALMADQADTEQSAETDESEEFVKFGEYFDMNDDEKLN